MAEWPRPAEVVGVIPRVLLADGHPLVRAGLQQLLADRGVVVVGEAATGAEALREALALRPDVVLMDKDLPKVSGIDATRLLCRALPDTRIVILTMSALECDVIDALVAGATGYVLKNAPIETILVCVRAAMKGHAAFSPEVADTLVTRVRREAAHRHSERADSRLSSLTDRELAVLRQLVRGQNNRAIAARLHITTNTVKNHVSAILRKLGVTNRSEAAVLAHEQALSERWRARP